MKKQLKIVLLIPSSRGYERTLLSGIAKYARYHGPWIFYMELPDYGAKRAVRKKLDWLHDIGADGIVARIPYVYEVEDLIKTRIPFIFTDIQRKLTDLPCILPDCESMAKMGVEYFLEKGYTNFAFCGFANSHWCNERGNYFSEFVRRNGYHPHFFFEKSGQLTKSWEKQETEMVDWLLQLPQPVGILTSNDDMGRHLIQSCRIAGLMVPEEVAVLGADNDILVCELSEPSLSSIAYNIESSGYQAAEILHQMIDNKPLTQLDVVVKPTHIVTRQSTDILAIEDQNLTRALNFINQNFKNHIKVTDIARAAAVSVRVLQKKFQELLGRTPHEEVTRVRMEYAVMMLIESNLPLSNIAYSIGFEEVKYFTRLFTKSKGLSPVAYRKKYGQK